MAAAQNGIKEPVVDMLNVSIRYGSDPEVLSDIKLSLDKGSFHFLTGKSGAGKTSLLSMMYLALKPSRGTVTVFGTNIGFASRDTMALMRRRIGVVFQDFRLLEHLSAYDNVAVPLRVRGMKEGEIDKRVKELLRWVELENSMNKICSTLSGGEKQRIAIARALSVNPKLILLDEPVSSLDVSIQAGVLNLLEDLQNKLGVAYLLVAHNLSVIRHISSRVAVMYLGHIMEAGATDEVFDNPAHPYTQALISAVPVPDPEYERKHNRIVLQGELPSPAEKIEGCPFRMRCQLYSTLPDDKKLICQTQAPVLRPVEGDHEAACHFVDEAIRLNNAQ